MSAPRNLNDSKNATFESSTPPNFYNHHAPEGIIIQQNFTHQIYPLQILTNSPICVIQQQDTVNNGDPALNYCQTPSHPPPPIKFSSPITMLPMEPNLSQEQFLSSLDSVTENPSYLMCWSCKTPIMDKYLLKIQDESFWHEQCLKCSDCSMTLVEKCFVRDGIVFCRDDYYKRFSTKCAQCGISLRAEDYVLRCGQFIFHVDCFQCSYCKQQLRKDDRYYCVNDIIICQRDYNLIHLQRHLAEANFGISGQSPLEFLHLHHTGVHSHSKKLPKRPRTILNAQQRKAFKVAFDKGSKPSRKLREQLAKETNLSVRVVQVWFQNQRAKIKKDQRKRENGLSSGENRTGSIASGTRSEDSGDARGEHLLFNGNGRKSPESACSSKSFDSDVEVESEDEADNEEQHDPIGDRYSLEMNRPQQQMFLQGDSYRFLLPTEQHPVSLSTASSTEGKKTSLELNPIEKLYHMHQTYFTVT